MAYATDLLILAVLVAAGAGLGRLLPERFPLPRAMIGGLVGLLLGQGVAGLLPLDSARLELLVYHGLGLVFITVGLQSPAPGDGGRSDVRTIALSIPALAAIQGSLGLAFVILWTLGGANLHPGFGLLLPLGFGQGPGQALSLGGAWSEVGLTDGAALGLILAAAGFFWCALAGTAWLGLHGPEGPPGGEEVQTATDGGTSAPRVEPRRWPFNLLLVALIYAATLSLLAGLAELAGERPQLVATMWGFHFIIALLIALALRSLLHRLAPREESSLRIHDGAQAVFAGAVVELTTAAALSAIRLDVLATWWLPVLIVTSAGGVATLLYCRWLQARVFRDEPFRHALLLFGTGTGTLLTGMALLRVSDPHLRTPVAANQVRATPLSIPLMAPVLVGLMPWVVSLTPRGAVSAAATGLAILAVYATVLVLLVRRR